MIKGCLFDLDGTLVDSLVDLAYTTNKILRCKGYPEHELNAYNHFVGNGVKNLLLRALPSNHQNDIDECLAMFHDIYNEHCLDHTSPYEGIVELIRDLKQEGLHLAVVTNKPHHLACKIVDTLFPGCFEVVLGQQDSYPIKPDPTSSLIALAQLHIHCDECVFIGDSDVDIQTGHHAHMQTIGVCWGFRGRNELEKQHATYVVDHALEIKEIIHENRC